MKSTSKWSRNWFRTQTKFVGMLALGFAFAAPVYAQAGGASPWENAVNVLQTAFTGPIAKALALIAIVVGGLTVPVIPNDKSKPTIPATILQKQVLKRFLGKAIATSE